MNQQLASYYHDRANEYDKIYLNPDEQGDLHTATNLFQERFANKTVLELACGTGYWTERIAKVARSIHATDINQSVIDIAKRRLLTSKVTFEKADMYQLSAEKKYDGLFGGFIWSHIPLQDMDQFLHRLKDLVHPGGTLVFIDSKNGPGTIHEKRISKADNYGNSYQERKLDNGTPHLVLKNFPTEDFLVKKLSLIADNIRYTGLQHYWIVCCNLTIQK